MNAQEAEKLSIERKPLYEREQKEKAKQDMIDRLAELHKLIETYANKGEQVVCFDDSLQSTSDAFIELGKEGYYTTSNYYGGATTIRRIEWGKEADRQIEMQRKRDLEIMQEGKKQNQYVPKKRTGWRRFLWGESK